MAPKPSLRQATWSQAGLSAADQLWLGSLALALGLASQALQAWGLQARVALLGRLAAQLPLEQVLLQADHSAEALLQPREPQAQVGMPAESHQQLQALPQEASVGQGCDAASLCRCRTQCSHRLPKSCLGLGLPP